MRRFTDSALAHIPQLMNALPFHGVYQLLETPGEFTQTQKD
jgi:hypothetical protein